MDVVREAEGQRTADLVSAAAQEETANPAEQVRILRSCTRS